MIWPFKLRWRARQAASPAGRAVFELLFREVLEELEEDYSRLLLAIKDGKNPGLLYTEYVLEVALYLLHCLDVCALKECGNKYRIAFMDSAVLCSSEIYYPMDPLTLLSIPRSDFYRDWIAHQYRSRQRQYSQYTLPARNKPLKGTLFWEYGKHICFSIGVVNPLTITRCASQAQSWFERAAGMAKTL